MSGIRSTLDIVMERTKNLTLSEEEKEKLRIDGCTKKCISLVSRYLAHIIDAAAIRSQFDEDRQECPEMETIFKQEFIRALDPLREKETLATGLKDILAIEPSPYLEFIATAESELGKLLAGETEKKLTALRQRGVHGSAVLPNMTRDPAWKESLTKLTASLHEELGRL